MPRSVAEIQADIDRVKAQIAYNQKYSQGFAQPSTKVGWNSYIINNDRGLLDAYQARENAWKQQMANADMQKELAGINKQIADEDKMDDYMRMRNKAAATYKYAEAALEAARKTNITADITKAERELALAKHDLDYYNKKTGFTEVTNNTPADNQNILEQKDPTPANREESKSVPVKLTDSKAIKRFKTTKARDEHVAKLEAMDPEGQDPEIQAEIIRTRNLDTDEDKAARKKDFDKRWNDLPKTANGDPKPGALAKAKKDPEFAKLYKEFKGDK